jgi:hypothetical protein
MPKSSVLAVVELAYPDYGIRLLTNLRLINVYCHLAEATDSSFPHSLPALPAPYSVPEAHSVGVKWPGSAANY